MNKRHTALSYHRIREVIAKNIISFFHVPGIYNTADILTKLWGYQQVHRTLRALFFYPGDAAELLSDHEDDTDDDTDTDTVGSDDRGVINSSPDEPDDGVSSEPTVTDAN